MIVGFCFYRSKLATCECFTVGLVEVRVDGFSSYSLRLKDGDAWSFFGRMRCAVPALVVDEHNDDSAFYYFSRIEVTIELYMLFRTFAFFFFINPIGIAAKLGVYRWCRELLAG